jgi:hypothetical protein
MLYSFAYYLNIKNKIMKSITLGALTYNIEDDNYGYDKVPHPYIAKYLRGVYKNEARFIANFYNPLVRTLNGLGRGDRVTQVNQLRTYFNELTEFTYKEAFELTNNTFRAVVFGSINVVEMINNLGHTRINVEGKEVLHRKYKEDGSYTMETYSVIYELHKIDCSALDVEDNYCVKCWCTSTNKEHWLWVEPNYAKNGALEAIASTVRVYENMLPHIKTIKRQGDVLLFEMKQEIIPSGNIIALTAEQYFSLLVSQS